MRFALALSFFLMASGPCSGLARRVLWIMADDFRPELGCYGSLAKTPHLDELAKRSLLFERAYCQQAVCNPSRSSLLTGRRPDHLRVWSNSLHFRQHNPDVETIPGWLRKQGYLTLNVGKIFHNWHTAVKGDPGSWSQPEFLHYANHGHDHALGEGVAASRTMLNQGRRYGEMELCESRDVEDAAYYDGRVAAEAVRRIAELPRDQPWFLAVGFWKPHAPFNAPQQYWDLYDRTCLSRYDPAAPKAVPAVALHASTEILGPPKKQIKPSAEQALEMRHGYFANISFFDAQVGKVIDALTRSGMLEETLIIFTADHGYHVGEHGLWGKTSNFELDAHVPLLIAGPSISRPGRTDSLVELIDLFPTLVECCGLPAPAGLDGCSLVPILRNPEARVKRFALTQHPRPAYFDRESGGVPEVMGYSLRLEDARCVLWQDFKTGEFRAGELYLTDTADSEEMRNEFDNPVFKPIVERARVTLSRVKLGAF